MDLSWSFAVDDRPIEFVIRYRARDGKSGWKIVDGIQDAFRTLQGLESEMVYDIQVKARNEWGWSEWSEMFRAQTGTGERQSYISFFFVIG